MDAKDAYQRTSALLDDFFEPLGTLHTRRPLRAMGDLVRGILRSGCRACCTRGTSNR